MSEHLGEFQLIERIQKRFRVPAGTHGIGDDCAVLPQKDGVQTLVSTDMLVEGTHFLLSDITPAQLGWKSAAVNISDIAAMGGRPVGTFLSLALPKDLPSEWMDGFMDGYQEISDLFSVPLLGGDTTGTLDRMCINVAILGEIQAGRSRLRSAAVPGDLICVTGCLGDSAAGLNVILKSVQRDAAASELVRRHYCPMPRVEEGVRLSACSGVHAMMDISDGVASDLRHILDASGVGATVDVSRVPMSDLMLDLCRREGWDPATLALSGGEDYELLFTVDPASEAVLEVPHTVIGVIETESGLRWKGGCEDYMGFRHF